MRLFLKLATGSALVAISLCGAFGQKDVSGTGAITGEPHKAADKTQRHHKARENHSLTSDDRLSLLAAALDKPVLRDAEPDCSHLVHAIYEAAGFPYDYAPSSDLYAGVKNFERVKSPLPGDLVVWRGHAGIVIKPPQHIFFSYLTSGPGTDDYEDAYWKHRGHLRFYRYVKRDLRPE